MRNKFVLQQVILLGVCFSFASCQIIGGIFKAGVWSGVLLVVGVIALIIFIIAKVAGKK